MRPSPQQTIAEAERLGDDMEIDQIAWVLANLDRAGARIPPLEGHPRIAALVAEISVELDTENATRTRALREGGFDPEGASKDPSRSLNRVLLSLTSWMNHPGRVGDLVTSFTRSLGYGR